MALTPKQQLFVSAYLTCWNATQSARLAGYKGSYGTLRVIGHENLTKLNILTEIKARLEKYAMGANEVLARLADQARGDLAEFAKVKSIKDLPDNPKSHLVKKVKTTRRITKDDEEIITTEIELYDAHAALVDIGKYHGLFVERHELTGKDGGDIILKVYGNEAAKDV